MTDRDAILEAIFAAPADDAPRLVYADWIEERGEPDYADLIRLQCAIARIPEQTPERDGLWRSLNRAWTALHRKWYFEPYGIPIDLEQFERGIMVRPSLVVGEVFMFQSACWWPEFVPLAVEIEHVVVDPATVRWPTPYLGTLVSLRLPTSDAGPLLAAILDNPRSDSLRTLDLGEYIVTPADEARLLRPGRLPRLTRVTGGVPEDWFDDDARSSLHQRLTERFGPAYRPLAQLAEAPRRFGIRVTE